MNVRRYNQLKTKNFCYRAENPEQDKLIGEAMDYEYKYFKDMILELKYFKELNSVDTLNDNGEIEKWNDCVEFPQISICDWRISEKRLRRCEGTCKFNSLEIQIKSNQSKEKRLYAFLHEMIHAYEDTHYLYGRYLPELMLLYLYRKLEKELGKSKFNDMFETITGSLFGNFGHSLLFILKSIDIDMRLKIPFGTIAGYGREKWLKVNR